MKSGNALICLNQGYGNIIMATPLIRAVAELDYHVTALIQGNYRDAAGLLFGWKILNRIYTDRTLAAGWAWDIVVQTLWWPPEYDIPAKKRVRPDTCDLRSTHESEANLTAAHKLGWYGYPPMPHCESDTLPDSMPKTAYIALCPGYGGQKRADWHRKAWPHWEALLERLRLPIVILGSELDYEPWMQGQKRYLGTLTIRQAAGVIKHAHSVVAVDNGLAHIAGALGKRVVAIFGATSEAKNRPLGRDVRVVTAPMGCRPCQMTKRWNECADWHCMKAITVEHVLEAMG